MVTDVTPGQIFCIQQVLEEKWAVHQLFIGLNGPMIRLCGKYRTVFS
jgi:hypothetical protein